MARAPIAEERLSVDGDGLVVLELKREFRDGTTQVKFEPEDFIAPLPSALNPRISPSSIQGRTNSLSLPTRRQHQRTY